MRFLLYNRTLSARAKRSLWEAPVVGGCPGEFVLCRELSGAGRAPQTCSPPCGPLARLFAFVCFLGCLVEGPHPLSFSRERNVGRRVGGAALNTHMLMGKMKSLIRRDDCSPLVRLGCGYLWPHLDPRFVFFGKKVHFTF